MEQIISEITTYRVYYDVGNAETGEILDTNLFVDWGEDLVGAVAQFRNLRHKDGMPGSYRTNVRLAEVTKTITDLGV